MKKKIVQVKDLSKSYTMGNRKLQVLQGVSFDIVEGSFLTLVGPSGVGKSTLLHLIGALDEPASGKVYFENVNLFGLSERARSRLRNEKIGLVFQFYHLLPEFNALENVALPTLIYFKHNKVAKAAVFDKAAQLLAEVGLSQREKHRPNQLSGGEQQRVAIARALMNDPKLLLADEPTGNLDSQTGEQIHEMLVSFNKKRKCTLVVVTHDEKWTKQSDQVLIMADGKVNANIH